MTPKVGGSSLPIAAESSARLAVGSSGLVMSGTVMVVPRISSPSPLIRSSTRSITGKRFTTTLPFSTFARLLSSRRIATSCSWTKVMPRSQTWANASLA